MENIPARSCRQFNKQSQGKAAVHAGGGDGYRGIWRDDPSIRPGSASRLKDRADERGSARRQPEHARRRYERLIPSRRLRIAPGWNRNAPGSVIVVTLVIAAMSFYLIALVVWMALNYRTSTTAPARAGARRSGFARPDEIQRSLSSARERFFVPGAGPCRRRSQASRWFRSGPAAMPSSPTRARQWRWNIARPIWPPSERSGR